MDEREVLKYHPYQKESSSYTLADIKKEFNLHNKNKMKKVHNASGNKSQ